MIFWKEHHYFKKRLIKLTNLFLKNIVQLDYMLSIMLFSVALGRMAFSAKP